MFLHITGREPQLDHGFLSIWIIRTNWIASRELCNLRMQSIRWSYLRWKAPKAIVILSRKILSAVIKATLSKQPICGMWQKVLQHHSPKIVGIKLNKYRVHIQDHSFSLGDLRSETCNSIQGCRMCHLYLWNKIVSNWLVGVARLGILSDKVTNISTLISLCTIIHTISSLLQKPIMR